jgi:hypothetical protein
LKNFCRNPWLNHGLAGPRVSRVLISDQNGLECGHKFSGLSFTRPGYFKTLSLAHTHCALRYVRIFGKSGTQKSLQPKPNLCGEGDPTDGARDTTMVALLLTGSNVELTCKGRDVSVLFTTLLVSPFYFINCNGNWQFKPMAT